MNRRTLLFLLAACSVLGSPPAAAIEPAGMRRIGFLSPASPTSMTSRLEAFHGGLRDLGYIEGRSLAMEYRWADGKLAALERLAGELAGLKVDVLIVHGVAAAHAARRASTTIPIVCFGCDDVIASGLVASLARPGGNVTGLTVISPEVSPKRLELLREVVPGLTRVAVLWNPANPVSVQELKRTEAAARSLGIQLQLIGVQEAAALKSALSPVTRAHADALLVLSDAMLYGQLKEIAALAAVNGLPSVSWTGEYAAAGGLMGYGPDVFALARRAASYVDKLLKGARPADLPIEQPTKFELVVNLATARVLGRTLPTSLLQRADAILP